MSYENKPYVWWGAEEYPSSGELILQQPELSMDIICLRNSRLISGLSSPLSFHCRIEEKKISAFDILSNNSGAPIVSEKVVDLLSRFCASEFQYFNIDVSFGKNEMNKPINQYYIINILNEIDSIDRSLSYLNIDKKNNQIDAINKLRFMESCMMGLCLAREKHYHPLKLISPKLVQIFKENNIKGACFLTDSESYNSSFPEEYLIAMFPEDPEAAKRYFVNQLNRDDDYNFFKTRVSKMPKELLIALIDMTLSRSSFHAEQCEELRRLMDD